MKSEQQIRNRIDEIQLRIDRLKNLSASSEISDLDDLSIRELALIRDFLEWTLK